MRREAVSAPTGNLSRRLIASGRTATGSSFRFPMPVRLQSGHEGLMSVFRGPLLFALKMGEDWVKIGGEAPHNDWEVYPTDGLELWSGAARNRSPGRKFN